MNNTEFAIRKNKSVMKVITLIIFIWASAVAQGHAQKYTDEGEKSFTFVQQFVFHHQKYDDVILTDFLTEPLDVNNGPDRQLVRFLSSILADDFEWWLSHWSAETQQDWLDKISINKAQRTFNYWKARFGKKTEAQLIDFVVLGKRALVGVELKNSSTDYYLIAFAFENNRWRIDQPFMNSLLYSKIKHKLRN